MDSGETFSKLYIQKLIVELVLVKASINSMALPKVERNDYFNFIIIFHII